MSKASYITHPNDGLTTPRPELLPRPAAMEAVVVSSTEGVLQILLGKLGAVLAEKYVLLSGVAREIQELKEDLEIMNACLRDLAAGTEYHHSEQVLHIMQ